MKNSSLIGLSLAALGLLIYLGKNREITSADFHPKMVSLPGAEVAEKPVFLLPADQSDSPTSASREEVLSQSLEKTKNSFFERDDITFQKTDHQGEFDLVVRQSDLVHRIPVSASTVTVIACPKNPESECVKLPHGAQFPLTPEIRAALPARALMRDGSRALIAPAATSVTTETSDATEAPPEPAPTTEN